MFSTESEISNIVIRGANWIGDAVMTLPAIQALREAFPHANISILSPERNADVFRAQSAINEVIAFETDGAAYTRARRQAKLIRERGFEVGIVLPNSFESALALALANIPHRIGYATDFRKALMTKAVPTPHWKRKRHESFYYLALIAEAFGTPMQNEAPKMLYSVPESAVAAGFELLAQYGRRPDAPLIAIGPGSTNSAAKRWPAQYFGRLCTLIARSYDVDFVLLGSSGDAAAAIETSASTDVKVIDLVGKTNLAEAIGILSAAAAFISNDMGLAHLGGAIGIPTAVIFGPTDDRTTRPLGAKVRIIREPVECSPCMLRNCPIDHRCMTRLLPERVFEEIKNWVLN